MVRAVLVDADDTLWHQLPTSFTYVHTSDPRFYDRYWFAAYDPRGNGALQFTMGAYNNMNVVDAGFVLVHAGRQHNLRASRSLRPSFEPNCGPFSVEVVRPLQEFVLTIADETHSIQAELTWRGILPPEEEEEHLQRLRGRVTEHYSRFNQIGRLSGWVIFDGHRLEIDDWWSARDHSWGVRPRMGVREPVTGPTSRLADEGFAMAFLFFSTDTHAGYVHVNERGGRRGLVNGVIRDRRHPDKILEVANVSLKYGVFPGTRRVETVSLTATLTDGSQLVIDTDAQGPAIAMPGLGYSGGFDDGKGLGVWRGDSHLEHEIWDVSAVEDVVTADGEITRPWHRIQPVVVRTSSAEGSSLGNGSMTAMVSGHLPHYGLPVE